MARNYSSTATEKQLASNVSNVATQITLDNATNLPAPPFMLVLNPDTNIEEIVSVDADQTGVISPTFKVTRAQDGTSAQTHTGGQVVRHMIVGSDLQLVSTHTSATEAHGATGAVVGTTNTQTLTNKTLTSPKINENVAVTATATELNYVDGVTSAIQTQIDSKVDKTYSIIAAKTGAYTVASGDESDLIQLNGTFTVSIPTDATFNFAVGTVIDVLNIGTGVITISAVTPGTTTVNGTPGLKLRSQWSAASLIKRAANTWVVIGDLVG
jgi:hypothetical protein